jgi:tellurite resistance protein TerC
VKASALRWIRRIGITLVGFSVVTIGILMIVLPGPAVVVIPIGLAILGLEYAWARRWLRKAKEQATIASGTLSNLFWHRRRRG